MGLLDLSGYQRKLDTEVYTAVFLNSSVLSPCTVLSPHFHLAQTLSAEQAYFPTFNKCKTLLLFMFVLTNSLLS